MSFGARLNGQPAQKSSGCRQIKDLADFPALLDHGATRSLALSSAIFPSCLRYPGNDGSPNSCAVRFSRIQGFEDAAIQSPDPRGLVIAQTRGRTIPATC